MNSPTVNNGWLGSEAFNDLQRLLKGLNAQQIIDGFENTHILISGATRTAPLWRSGNSIAEIRYGELLHQLMEMGFTLTQVGATNPTAMATSSSTWLEGVLEKNIQLVAGGLGEFFQGLNGTVSKWNYYNPMYATGWVSYDNTFTNALDYGQRLMKVAAAVDDPILDAEVLRSDFLSELVNFGGNYLSLRSSFTSFDTTKSVFLETLFRGGNPQNISDELEDFLKGTISSDQRIALLRFQQNILKSLPQIQQFQAGSKNSDFVSEMIRTGKEYILMQNQFNAEKPLIIDDLSGFMFDIWSSRSVLQLKSISGEIQSFLEQKNPTLLASSNLSSPISYLPYSTSQLRKEKQSWTLSLNSVPNYERDYINATNYYNQILRQGITLNGVQVVKQLKVALGWIWVKAMVEGAESTDPNSDARKYDPMQLANAGDPALVTMKVGGEGTQYYLPDWVRGKLQTVLPTPFDGNGAPDYSGYPNRTSEQRMYGSLGIAAGIAWLISRASILDGTGKIVAWSPNPSKGWQQAIIDYNGGGNPEYWRKVSGKYTQLVD